MTIEGFIQNPANLKDAALSPLHEKVLRLRLSGVRFDLIGRITMQGEQKALALFHEASVAVSHAYTRRVR